MVAPLEALTDPALSEPERRVLLVLFSFRNKSTDIVFPGIDAIAERAGYADKTRISKLTNGLAKKGWLTKKRRGFTGGNEYTLMVPERAIQHLANLDSEANLEPAPKMDQEAKANLDSETNTNLDSEAKYKEQTIEQTIEHKAVTPSEVMSLYNEILGDLLPRSQILSDVRRKSIKARIGEDAKREFHDWWRTYFTVVAETPFLTGQGPPKPDTGRPWKANLEWLINQNNMAKVIEGNYENE